MDLVVFLPLILIMGAFMFFASRRQKKAMHATIDDPRHQSRQPGGIELVTIDQRRDQRRNNAMQLEWFRHVASARGEKKVG